MSKIEWTNKTWNPVVGCNKVSAGCKNCYAINMAWRLQHIGHSKDKYAGTVEKTAGGQLNWTGKVNTSERDLLKPLTWKKPAMIFVNSESDLFHESIPFDFIDKIFAVMGRCQHHTFQVLTKRPERMLEYYKSDPYQRILNASYQLPLPEWLSLGTGIDNPNFNGNWGWKHVWLGVSCEDQKAADERIPLLLQVPAAVRFLSCEPLLGPVDLEHLSWYDNSYYQVLKPITGCGDSNRPAIDWVICGGESGSGARPLHPEWVRSLRDQCTAAGTAFFFKQWGEYYTKSILMGTGVPIFRMFASMQHWINKAQTWVRGGRCISIDGRECHIGKDFQECAYPVVIMDKVGKKNAGRMLDGREWSEFPGKQTAPADDPDLYVGGFD